MIRMKFSAWTPAILLFLLLAACRPATRVSGGAETESGIASWYGHPYHGRKTASGEIYDMEQLTAAHRLLAFGTVVRVTNLANHNAVEVRINDRGPFVKGRIIDLSHAAAQVLKIDGIAEVSIKILSVPATRAILTYSVQAGLYADKEEAERVREALAAKYGSAKIILRDGDPQTWRVLVGSEPTVEIADSLGQKLQSDTGMDYFVVALDSD
jgi:rare lipoprotein A